MVDIKVSVLLDGNLIQANGLARFTYIPSGRPYLIYTLNEKTIQKSQELNKIYTSEVGDQNTQFQPINEDEWINIKNIIGQMGDKVSPQVPNNIQLSQLSPIQYIVGPYRKLAIEDLVRDNMQKTQIENQPKEEQIVQPTGNTQFFDPSLNVSAMEESAPAPTEVPNAFNMATPVPEEAAPISLVEQAPQAEVQTPVVGTPVATTIVQEVQPTATELVQPIEMPAQAVEMPQVAQPVEQIVQPVELVQPVETAPVVANTELVQPTQVVETTIPEAQPVDEITIVKQSLQTVLNYCNGDMDKLNQLLNEQGLTIVVQNKNEVPTEVAPVETVAETNIQETQITEPVAEVQEKFPEPVTSVSDMSIDNLPVVEQEAPAEDNVLNEESFEPTVPTLPVDNMEASNVVNSLPDGVIPGGLPSVQETPVATVVEPEVPVQSEPVNSTVITQPVAETPVMDNVVQFPTQEVAAQPVETNNVTIDNVVPFVANTNTVPVQQPAQVEPAVPVVNTEVAQQAPVTPVENFEVPTSVQPVEFIQPQPVAGVNQTQIIQPEQTTPSAPVAVDAIQETEVNLAVPQDIAPNQSADLGMPAITPVTLEDVAPVTSESPAEPQIDTSTFLDAGPVIMPVGQESVSSQGLPGDSGAKVLERVA